MMRLNFLLISLVFVFFIRSVEAADSYSKIYYSKLGTYGTAILGLPNGDSVLAGISYEHTYYAVFAKFNAEGEVLFEKTYESKNDRFHIQIESMAQASDGSYFLAGHMCPGVCTDAIVIRVNESGKIVWTKSFGTKLIDYFTSIVATPDGGFALAVVSGVDRGFTSYRALVIRANSEGKVAWSKLFEFSSEVAEIYPLPSIAIAPNGGFLFVSEAEFEHEHYGLLLVRFDGSGTVVWKKTISLPNSLKADDYYYGSSVTSTADSGYVVAANSHNIVDGKNKSFVELLKLDASGKVKWAKSYEAEKSIEINGAI
ncbi:PQQ-like beta-propeller repeat protein, partial [bacterium]|nr:PQQ-like beta-propeller repeat protein [bacterium]